MGYSTKFRSLFGAASSSCGRNGSATEFEIADWSHHLSCTLVPVLSSIGKLEVVVVVYFPGWTDPPSVAVQPAACTCTSALGSSGCATTLPVWATTAVARSSRCSPPLACARSSSWYLMRTGQHLLQHWSLAHPCVCVKQRARARRSSSSSTRRAC